MKRQQVVVVGSYNTDVTIKTPRLPRPGETVIGRSFTKGPGGKGANQAVSAARAGADVTLIARLGADAWGDDGFLRLQEEGVRTSFVTRDSEAPTGTAWIIVDDQGENCIVVSSGANALLSPEDVMQAETEIAEADILLMQLESPIEAVTAALNIAARHGVRVILNPAPARNLSRETMEKVSVLTPNRVEAEFLTGVTIVDRGSLTRASHTLLGMGIETVIITLGSNGIFAATAGEAFWLPAFQVRAIDTTAAGDVFNGCLAAFLDGTRSLRDAVSASSAGAALSVMKPGAQESAPSREAIEAFLLNQPPANALTTTSQIS